MNQMKHLNGEGMPKHFLPFSPAVQAGDFIFVSGQASVDGEGNIVTESFEKECRRSFDNVKAITEAAGFTLQDICQVKSYVDKQENLAAYNAIYREYFTAPFPARTTLIGCLGEILKFEVDVIIYTKK